MSPWENKTSEQIAEMKRKSAATKRRNSRRRNRERERAIIYRGGLKKEIQELHKQRRSLRKQNKLDIVAIGLTDRRLLRESDILSEAKPWKNNCGVYFLIRNEQVVYVGQSVNVYSRIATHNFNNKFTHYAIIFCNKHILDKLESLYIHLLSPIDNGQVRNSTAKVAPLTLPDLLGAI